MENKIKNRILYSLLPLAVMWIIFYVGYLIGFSTEEHWYSFPFFFSSLAVFVLSLAPIINSFD